MKKKIFITLFVIYVGQFLSSCCRDSETYEVTFAALNVTNLKVTDNSLFPLPNGDKVDKSNFALSIVIQEDFKQIASNFTDFNGFGFQKSYAAITCPEDNFVYIEKVTAITIYQIDANNSKIDVTNNFKVNDINNQFITISDFVDKIEFSQNSFEFFLKDETNIESNVQFEVVVESSTNQTLSFTTEEVQFN